MPIVSIPEHVLFKKLGRSYTEDEFTDLCFAYGLELDEITSEQKIIAREQGKASGVSKSTKTIFKIEVPANRHDLLCSEGITRALLIFQNKLAVPEYRTLPEMNYIQCRAHPSVLEVRPFFVAAVLRNITFDEDVYASFIDLQDKLHQNICRKRTLVSIGTHDLDTLHPPFIYDAQPPENIEFVALGQTNSHTAVELMDIFSTKPNLKPYLPIIKDKAKYPIFKDSMNTILSMPPIINSEHSKVTLSTRNIFIEVTATDLTKASIVLDILVTMFSEYCAIPFTVEPVEVIQADKTRSFYPRLEYRSEVVSVDYINSLLGVNCSEAEVAHLLTRMSLNCQLSEEPAVSTFNLSGDQVTSGLLSVRIPPTRHDILHPCDIAEDAAIAFGYDRIEEHLPQSYSMVNSQPLNHLTDMVRAELAQAGYTEALTFSLCSRADISTNIQKQFELQQSVEIQNPKTMDFQVVRTTLLPGILHTIANNQSLPLPLKLFEVQDVILKTPKMDVGCKNCRRICAAYCSKVSGFESIHGLLDRMMQIFGVAYDVNTTSCKMTYRLAETDDNTFFPERCADIILSPADISIGRMGIVHPIVLQNFGLAFSVSSFEINLEPFL